MGSLGVKRLGCETDHSPPSSAKVEEWVQLYLHSPKTPSWHGARLKHSDNYTLLFVWLKVLTKLCKENCVTSYWKWETGISWHKYILFITLATPNEVQQPIWEPGDFT
jgi:hypothetical protein